MNRSFFNTASCRCDLVAGVSELVCNEIACARTDAEDEDSGLGRHVGGERVREGLSNVQARERRVGTKRRSVQAFDRKSNWEGRHADWLYLQPWAL